MALTIKVDLREQMVKIGTSQMVVANAVADLRNGRLER